MDLFEAIKKRHSYRGGFEDKPVPRAHLRQIVQAGLDAPSGCNAQTPRFVIVDDPALVRTLAGMHDRNKAMQQARAFIACIIDKEPPAVYQGMSFQIEDCAAAVENMLLAITALGYGSVWVDGWLRIDGRAEIIGNMLGLPAGKCLRVLLPIGLPCEEIKPPAKKPFDQRAWFNAWEQGQ
ncbi:MAG: nitroreductase [Planctomycetes bacterium]|jgi:nitroreductase|nr:nitroreductase [Planctomycetota bacterium]